ncbi:MAG: caspase family protein, partial [Mucilaginibacter sp.]
LFHNGKIINLATRGLFVTDNTTGTDSKKYTLNLLPGANSIRAVALNSQRTESQPDEIIVRYEGGTAQPNIPARPAGTNTFIAGIDKDATVHLIVVGINQYKNPKMSLNYALADATAFKNEAERDAGTVTANIKTYFITDDKADKAGILQAFKTVQQNAKPQDVLVFYYAGHGVISDKNKEFYLVPTDVTDLKNVDEALAEHGIPSKLLQQYAVDISAQKQVFILDACQSAGAFATLMSNDAGKLKSLALVARSTGTHWIAASGSQQFANEFSQLGHGAFTYVLLKAMKGEAVSNKMVTVNGLKSYLQTEVPDLMKKYNGTPQYPASYGFGSDFPVEVIK